jgi:hypothetical protein
MRAPQARTVVRALRAIAEVVAAIATSACASGSGARGEGEAVARVAPVASNAAFGDGDSKAFVVRHAPRAHVSIPLPDGSAWAFDDGAVDVVAEHRATQSRLSLRTTVEHELMNRATCEERAVQLGLVPRGPLRTVENEVLRGPDELDTRIWVVLEPGLSDASPVTGHVFAFGAHLRKCMMFRYETHVSSARDGEELSARLARVRSRVIPGIHFDDVLESVAREPPALPHRRAGRVPPR